MSITFTLLLLAAEPSATVLADQDPCADYERSVGLEANVLWPIFPGGISELRLMIPVLNSDRQDFRGELVVGTYADFAHRVVRKADAAKTGVLAAKLGYRQFLWSGTHLEASINAGWRRETQRADGEQIDALQARLWLLAGYQYDFDRRFYANARGGGGFHLYRSDRFASEERFFVAGADLNLGVRF
jgi:hypothetical protein